MERYVLWVGSYLALWSDGTLTHDDGFEYVGETDAETVKSLYEAMKMCFNQENNNLREDA